MLQTTYTHISGWHSLCGEEDSYSYESEMSNDYFIVESIQTWVECELLPLKHSTEALSQYYSTTLHYVCICETKTYM